MALPTVGGGYQIGDGNLSEIRLGTTSAPATATATATLTTAQLLAGILLGSPGSSAATYTSPTAAAIDTALGNAKVGSYFDLSIINIDGSGSGVITLDGGTGVTKVGLMTVVATAGTAQVFRFRRTGAAAWTVYRYS